MAEYIEDPLGQEEEREQAIKPPIERRLATTGSTQSNPLSGRDVFSFPIITALLRDFANMSPAAASATKTGRPRGRRAAAKVPCDECIARASEKKEEGASIELCERCTAALHRPRRKQQQEATKKQKVRVQSNGIVDTVFDANAGSIDTPWSGDKQEQHSVQFFVQHSSPQLAGYFDSPFWQRMVLQAGRHEPAVRHAIAAIGALHEKLLTGAVNPHQAQDKRTRFALEQCNKSIQHLVKPQNDSQTKPDIQLMLTTCVLFTCFEALQGHCEQAIIHATQGYSLLQQFAMDPENRRWDVGAFAVELDQLSLLMRRLQTQSKGLMAKDLNVIPDTEAINAKRPTTFNSLHEARSSLELVLNQLTVFFLDLDLDDQFYDIAVTNAEKRLLFGPWLADWERAFSSYLAKNRAKLNADERKAAMILKAHETVAEILADSDLSLGAMAWDAYHDKFAAIVNLATAVLEDSKQADTSVIEARWKTNGVFISAPSATLSFSLGIVDPLYEVCARCRDPVLRRKALDLLARHPRQELVWSSWSAWKVGKFLMRLEEEGTETQPKQASDIPADNRISECWIDFSNKTNGEPDRPRVGYKKAVPRASARYALNPGLFEDWETDTTDAGFAGDIHVKSPFSDSSASTVQQYTLAPQESFATAPLPLDEFDAFTWIDSPTIDAFNCIPSILETPPTD